MKWKFLFLLTLIFGLHSYCHSSETSDAEPISELERLQAKVRYLETAQTTTKTDVSELQEAIKGNGLALILFGIFCAWWAKNTGRSGWLWFFLGAIFHVFAGIALLLKTE